MKLLFFLLLQGALLNLCHCHLHFAHRLLLLQLQSEPDLLILQLPKSTHALIFLLLREKYRLSDHFLLLIDDALAVLLIALGFLDCAAYHLFFFHRFQVVC